MKNIRFKVIADYPNSINKVGDIIELPSTDWTSGTGACCDENYFERWPHIFKKMEWWENRTIDEMLKIKFVKIVEYEGYWRVGDIVPVINHELNMNDLSKGVLAFKLKYDKIIPVNKCEPSTLEEYKECMAVQGKGGEGK